MTILTSDDFTIDPTGSWTSPDSGAEYPSGWIIIVPKLGIEVQVKPVIENQELDTRGTTMIVYWEGACEILGKAGEKEIHGRAYVELVGYDRSHDQPNLSRFLLGSSYDFLARIVG